MKKKFLKTKKSQSGIATMPVILALGIIIVAIGVGITALSVSESIISHGNYQSSKAYVYAEAGIRDALERIARNKKYVCSTDNCYTIDFLPSGCADNTGCARVKVSSGIGTTTDQKVITSEGRAGNNRRTLEVQVIFDTAMHGEIATTTWREI